MKSDYFVKIEGVDGQSEDKNHAKWIEVSDFSFGSSQNITVQRGVDVSGRGQFEVFMFTHPVDKATPKLQNFCMAGKNIPTVELSVNRAIAGAQTEVLNVKLQNVKITSAFVTSKTTDGTVDPFETVKMVCGKMIWKVVPIKADNSKDGAIEAQYDQIQNA